MDTRLAKLFAMGFDDSKFKFGEYSIRCSRCKVVFKNGDALHQAGCKNDPKEQEDAKRRTGK